MNRNVVRAWIFASLVSLAMLGCGGAGGEEDVAATAHDPHPGGGQFTASSGGFELFAVYPHQIANSDGEEPWEIHLTSVEEWKPVEGARVTLQMVGPGRTREEVVARSDVPGVYLASPMLPTIGTWRAEFALSVEGQDYALPAGPFEVFRSEEEVDPHAGHDHDHEEDAGHVHTEDEEPDSGLITLAVEEQWSIPFAVAAAEEREIPASFAAAGELVAPPGGLVHVSAPVAGLVQVDGPSLGPGDFVRTGQLLALIAPIRLDNSYERTRVDVALAEREVERAERLLAAEAIPARRLEEARRNLEVAVAAFEAIRGGTPGNAGEDADSGLYQLDSPIDGMIAERDVALGEQVAVGDHAFTIVNTGTLWFVARVPARYAPETGRIRGAWFTVEGNSSPYTVSRVLSVGSMIDPDSRTLPVRFAVPNADRALKVGMLAEGQILIGDPEQGTAVPVSAIQDEDGLPVIYVKVTGASFERRVVSVGASDGSWTLVTSGIAPGEQVVTEGAYQVNLAALGTVEPSHGHAH
ncbi:MAG: efflux RND transporter periplasmic adaptor subunit [Acidobacteriota bacterium]|nr:efflux RND transporter periplasmic adaptor subunit [Acidobacteriota bacterium]